MTESEGDDAKLRSSPEGDTGTAEAKPEDGDVSLLEATVAGATEETPATADAAVATPKREEAIVSVGGDKIGEGVDVDAAPPVVEGERASDAKEEGNPQLIVPSSSDISGEEDDSGSSSGGDQDYVKIVHAPGGDAMTESEFLARPIIDDGIPGDDAGVDGEEEGDAVEGAEGEASEATVVVEAGAGSTVAGAGAEGAGAGSTSAVVATEAGAEGGAGATTTVAAPDARAAEEEEEASTKAGEGDDDGAALEVTAKPEATTSVEAESDASADVAKATAAGGAKKTNKKRNKKKKGKRK